MKSTDGKVTENEMSSTSDKAKARVNRDARANKTLNAEEQTKTPERKSAHLRVNGGTVER